MKIGHFRGGKHGGKLMDSGVFAQCFPFHHPFQTAVPSLEYNSASVKGNIMEADDLMYCYGCSVNKI